MATAIAAALIGTAGHGANTNLEATPINPADWITSNDYPIDALRANLQGTTSVLLRIGANGAVEDCRIEHSSGHPLLDSTTCNLLKSRARFSPVLNARGQAVATEARRRIVWNLPRFDEMQMVREWAFDDRGLVQSCGDERRFTSATFKVPCESGDTGIGVVPTSVKLLRRAGLTGGFKLRFISTVSRSKSASDVQLRDEDGWSQIARMQSEESIDPSGNSAECFAMQSVGPDELMLPICAFPFSREFAIARDSEGKPMASRLYRGFVVAVDNLSTKSLRTLAPDGTSARAIRLPETWVTGDDYPAEALENEWQGVVTLRWTVDAEGRSTDCQIVESTGYALLDKTSCELIEQRARFFPARDANGKATPSEANRRIVWALPLDNGI